MLEWKCGKRCVRMWMYVYVYPWMCFCGWGRGGFGCGCRCICLCVCVCEWGHGEGFVRMWVFVGVFACWLCGRMCMCVCVDVCGPLGVCLPRAPPPPSKQGMIRVQKGCLREA